MSGRVTTRDAPPPCDRLYRYQSLMSDSGRLMVLVLEPPARPGVLLCDGAPLVERSPRRCSAPIAAGDADDVRPGDRFTDPASGLTVICPEGGSGELTFAGRPLQRLGDPRRA